MPLTANLVLSCNGLVSIADYPETARLVEIGMRTAFLRLSARRLRWRRCTLAPAPQWQAVHFSRVIITGRRLFTSCARRILLIRAHAASLGAIVRPAASTGQPVPTIPSTVTAVIARAGRARGHSLTHSLRR
jgi:hypothetical protein